MNYITIVGGELNNKGAEAMTFTVINYLKSKFPNHEIVVLSSIDYSKSIEEINKYSFTILPWFDRLKLNFLGPLYSTLNKLKYKEYKKYNTEASKLEEILINTDYMIDVSGYALSSQRGVRPSIDYLLNIMIAKRYEFKMIIMPQSFGPFYYEKKYKWIMNYLINKYLKYPEQIFVREIDGIKYLEKYNLNNIFHSMDLVLQAKETNKASNIYKDNHQVNLSIDIKPNSIGLIPNQQTSIHGNSDEVYSFFDIIITNLLNDGKNVYLIPHSASDFKICSEIKESFKDNENVIFINTTLDSIEINAIIRKLDFLVASRYHAIVHAYKNFKPCIILGWAVKYQRIAEYFEQEDYMFDVREENKKETITYKLDRMLKSYDLESKKIEGVMNLIHESNVFDNLKF